MRNRFAVIFRIFRIAQVGRQKWLKSPVLNELFEKLSHGVDEFLDLKGGLERVMQKDRHLASA